MIVTTPTLIICYSTQARQSKKTIAYCARRVSKAFVEQQIISVARERV